MTDVHVEDHSTPIKTPQQLIVAVLLAFLVPILLIVMIVQLVTGGLRVETGGALMSEDAVATRLHPVGEVTLAQAPTATGNRSGEEVVKSVCQTCHGAGLLGSPKIGDAAAWKPRIAQGEKTLVEHALKGIRAMPAKGGNPDLSDLEVERATIWMANQGGARFKEPAAPAATPTATTPAAASTAAPAGAAASAKADGATVYQTVCSACHGAGLLGAPKFGDKAAWKPRIAQGLPALHDHALKGIRAMPAKGGNASLPDAEVTAAVDYMVSRSK